MKYIKDIENLDGKRVLVRVDFNVPIDGDKVVDDFRIKKALPLIDYLKKRNAKIILISHLSNDSGSLLPVFNYLKNIFSISFIEDYYKDVANRLDKEFQQGNIVLFENLRINQGEKENNSDFAKHLGSFADIYINEAFPESHREYASVVGVPQFIPGYAGLLFEEEFKNLSKAFNPEHPFVFVLGGAKFETKIPLLKKFFNLADHVFVGGALANDFFRAKGLNTGKSLVSAGNMDLSEFLNPKLILPTDVVVTNSGVSQPKKINEVQPDDIVVDVGPESIANFNEITQKAKFILWNGPLGNYELGFRYATLTLAKEISQTNSVSIVGGGDTVASIAELGLQEKFTFVSTAGGAMLDFLANETLPGIEALNKN